MLHRGIPRQPGEVHSARKKLGETPKKAWKNLEKNEK